MDILLGALIDAIVGPAFSSGKNKLSRNETVIRLLQKFPLNPEHPSANFIKIYVYALVEYGTGKPKAVLDLFREPSIREAFHDAFERNQPDLLLREAEDFLDWNILGDRIRDLDIELRDELAAFSDIFIQIAKRSRTPAEILLDQKLDILQETLTQLPDPLVRQTILTATHIQLTQQAQTNLIPATITQHPFPSFILAQQLQAWFETLGYHFESQPVWKEAGFEWILKIPARRHKWDRILIRCIEGEAETSDVQTLQQTVSQHHTDEGWLVARRRISPAARNTCTQSEPSPLFCYTFDELLDETANFNVYLDWLENDIQERNIPQYYVPLACTKEEFDPTSGHRLATSRYGERDGWIDGYIDRWLDDPTKEHISILGEFGTGKTWFALHCAWTALQRYRDAQNRGTARPRLPLVIPLRDYAKALRVQSLFSEFLFSQHKIGLPHYSVFEQLNRMGKLLLIFDGFDEMAARIDRQQMIDNFWELAKVIVPGAKAILTCRTEHFPEDREGRQLFNAELQASTNSHISEVPQFEVLELEKFSDDQIYEVLNHRASSTTTIQTILDNGQLLDLARRPVMIEFILEALPDIEKGKPVDLARVYLYAVRHKMERDIKADRTFTSLADKLYFLCEISWEMLSTNRMSLNYREFPDRIYKLFDSVVQGQKDLDYWRNDMVGQTMLIRNVPGDYRPAHRSLLEFFAAYKLAAELGLLPEDFTELAQDQSFLDKATQPQPYTWSSYFRRQVNEKGEVIPIPPLKSFSSESGEHIYETLSKILLKGAVLDLLLPILPKDSATKERLLTIIQDTKGRTESKIGYSGGNAATLLVKIDPAALEMRDLSNTLIYNANFTDASLRNASFARADLSDSDFTKVSAPVIAVAFSSDGQLLATAEGEEIYIWQIENANKEALKLTLRGHHEWVRAVAFAPGNPSLLASGGYDNTVRLWNTQSGETLHTLNNHDGNIRSVAFSPDGSILASSSDDKTIQLWNAQTGQRIGVLKGHKAAVRSVTFSPPDGRLLASGSEDKTIRLWTVETGALHKILQGHQEAVRSVAFSSDGRLLASGSEDKTVRLWTVKTGECQTVLEGHTRPLWSVAFSPDGQFLSSGGEDKIVRLWDMQTKEYRKLPDVHKNWVRSLAFSPNSRFLASGSEDKSVKVCNIQTGECHITLQGSTSWIWALAFSPDGQILASGSEDKAVRLWDLREKKCLRTFSEHEGSVRSISFGKNGKVLASGGDGQKVRIWDVEKGECLQLLEGHSSWIRAIVFSPDGKILASGSNDHTVKLWETNTWTCQQTLNQHTDAVRSVAFSPDSAFLASGSADNTIRVWNPVTGECLTTIEAHSRRVSSVIFNPDDGKSLASSGEDTTVKLWKVETGEMLHVFEGHRRHVNVISFSPNGEFLASGDSDKIIKLWEIKTGECIHTLKGHQGRVRSLAFSPDEEHLASCSDDETIKLWDIKTGKCRDTLSNKPYANMDITGIKGLSQTEKEMLKALGAVEGKA